MAKKNITQATYLTNNVQNLPDLVEGQAPLVKQTLDKVGLDGKTYVNETLITELESVTLNDSGAHRIGLNVANVTADNAADGIAEVKADIQGVVVGTIPDNTLTEAKMAADMKKQSGGVYPFDSGTDLETDVAANLVKLDIARTAITDTGIADAYVVDTAGTFDLTLDGNMITFIPSNTNTGASTFAVDAQTVKAIKKPDDTGLFVDTEEGDIAKNRPTQLAWSVGSDFFILRPSGGSNIKSIQTGVASVTNSELTKDVAISSVNTSNSVVIISVFSNSSQVGAAQYTAEITSSTNLRFTREVLNNSSLISWQVIEFNNVKSLQKGETSLGFSAPVNVSISSVNLAKSFVYFTQKINSTTTSADNRANTTAQLTSSTNLQFNQFNIGGFANWQIIEFK